MSQRIENIYDQVGKKFIIHGVRGKLAEFNNKVGKILQTSQQDMAKGRVLINLKVSENKIVKALIKLKYVKLYRNKWEEKFTLICKPEQSGKTFIMIQEIIAHINETDPKGRRIINIILCDNNLLLTKQTSNRVNEDLEKYVIGDIAYIELSSHNRTEYHDYTKVCFGIAFEKIDNVICCTNTTRIDDIYKIINAFNTSFSEEYYFKIWLDEADKFTRYIDNTFRPCVENFDNVEVFAISATVEKLFKEYKHMKVYPIENSTAENYHGWRGNNIIIKDSVENYLAFAENILREQNSEIKPGTKWFIPGRSRKLTHHKIKDLCLKYGMAVMIVNGDGISISIPGINHSFDHPKDDEFATLLIKLYNRYRLYNFPFVITGYICISRGISIMSEEFIFTHGILSECSSKAEASQIAGRLKGNIKHFKNYAPPTVYTTPAFNKIAIEMEKKSSHLCELAYRKTTNGGDIIINKSEYKTCGEDFEYIVHPDLFKSHTKAKKFLNTKIREMRVKSVSTTTKAIHPVENDYKVTTKLLSSGKRKTDLTKADRIIITRYNPSCNLKLLENIAPGQCISSTDKGSHFLIIPVYQNENSPPKSVRYEVRYISFK